MMTWSVVTSEGLMTIARYDAVDPRDPSKLRLTPFQTTLQEPKLFESELTANSTTEPFQFVFNCTATEDKCAKALNGYKSAGRRIANILQISTPIVVEANFFSFCRGIVACDDSSTLGQASSKLMWLLEKLISG